MEVNHKESSLEQYDETELYVKCPCGSGDYSILIERRSGFFDKDRIKMRCPVCKEKYRIYDAIFDEHFPSGSERFIWVSRELYDEYGSTKARFNKSRKEVANLLESKYMDTMGSCYHNTKTKKEFWRKLTDNGKRYPPLGSFYRHFSRDGLTDVLRHHVQALSSDYERAPIVLKKMGIWNTEIETRLKKDRETRKERGFLTKKNTGRLLMSRYKDKLLSCYRNAESKEEFWKALIPDDRKNYYKNFRRKYKCDCLKVKLSSEINGLCYDYELAPTILKNLGIEDYEVNTHFKMLKEIDDKLSEIASRIRQEGYPVRL